MINATKVRDFEAHSGALYALAYGRTEGTFFSAGADKVVAEWSIEQNEPNAFAIRTDHSIYSLLRPELHLLVIGTSAGSMHVIDLNENREIRHLKFHDKGIFHLLHLKERHHVYAASADGSVSLWDASDWSLLAHIPLTNQKVRKLALNPDETSVAAACGDGMVHFISTAQLARTRAFLAHQDSVNSLAFLSSNGILTGGKDALLKRWNIGDEIKALESLPAHNYAIYDIAVNNGIIATASRDKTVKLWEARALDSPKRLDRHRYGGHTHSVNALLWLDKTHFISCGDDRSAKLWKTENDDL